jgi:hypothetical protein
MDFKKANLFYATFILGLQKETQYQQIAKLLPKQRGNVKCENGCPWRALQESFWP